MFSVVENQLYVPEHCYLYYQKNEQLFSTHRYKLDIVLKVNIFRRLAGADFQYICEHAGSETLPILNSG